MNFEELVELQKNKTFVDNCCKQVIMIIGDKKSSLSFAIPTMMLWQINKTYFERCMEMDKGVYAITLDETYETFEGCEKFFTDWIESNYSEQRPKIEKLDRLAAQAIQTAIRMNNDEYMLSEKLVIDEDFIKVLNECSDEVQDSLLHDLRTYYYDDENRYLKIPVSLFHLLNKEIREKIINRKNGIFDTSLYELEEDLTLEDLYCLGRVTIDDTKFYVDKDGDEYCVFISNGSSLEYWCKEARLEYDYRLATIEFKEGGLIMFKTKHNVTISVKDTINLHFKDREDYMRSAEKKVPKPLLKESKNLYIPFSEQLSKVEEDSNDDGFGEQL